MRWARMSSSAVSHRLLPPSTLRVAAAILTHRFPHSPRRRKALIFRAEEARRESMEAEGTAVAGCFDQSAEKSFSHQEPSKNHCSDGAAAANAPPSTNACFDCSICLDSAVDPVVTLCGHLYCWPCIYKWLQVETPSPQQCPVCKSPVSQNSLVPLYGRGRGNMTAKSKGGMDIPNRPALIRDNQHQASSDTDVYTGLQPPMQQDLHHRYYPSPWGGMGMFSSTAGGVLSGLAIAILPLVSRNNQGGAEVYLSRLDPYASSRSSTSQRVQERRVEDSLHQIFAFLLSFAVLCLLFF